MSADFRSQATASDNGSISVAVVIPHLNRLEHTTACYQSLMEQDVRPAAIFIVDNGSTDNTAADLARLCPTAVVIRFDHNRGFSAAVNAGLREALLNSATTHCWLLNNDTLCPPDALGKLLEAADSQPDVGLVGSRMIEETSVGQPEMVAAGKNLLAPWMIPVSPRPDHAPDYLSGACMLVKRKVIESIGFFDDAFFFFFEDADFSRRAKSKGWVMTIAHDLAIRHHGSSTRNRINYFVAFHYRRSHVQFLKKYTRCPVLFAIAPFFMGLFNGAMHLNADSMRGCWEGFWCHWRGANTRSPCGGVAELGKGVSSRGTLQE